MKVERGTAARWCYKNEAVAAERDHERVKWVEGLVRQQQEPTLPKQLSGCRSGKCSMIIWRFSETGAEVTCWPIKPQ
jgi:(p)ppGpp synthase/HD superfamily hydrolase